MEQDEKRSLHLFASFDLCNSSRFKYSHPDWIRLYARAFELLHSAMVQSSVWSFWKANGDEMLFYRDNASDYDLDLLVPGTDKIMVDCLNCLYFEFQQFEDIRQLSIKTTLWLSKVQEYSPKRPDVLAATDYRVEMDGIVDFLGKETDTGFRIAHFAPRSKIALSAYLVYFLMRKHSITLGNVRIAGYRKLKGVWMDKKYPIIWLMRSRDPAEIKKSFHYDEMDDNNVINEFLTQLDRKPEYGIIENDEFINMLEYLGIKARYDKELSPN